MKVKSTLEVKFCYIIISLYRPGSDTNAKMDDVVKIWNACKDGDIGVVRQLFAERKLRENSQKDYDNTYYGTRYIYTLHIAAANGHLEVVKFLLENGKNINEKDEYGLTVLTKGMFSQPFQLVLIDCKLHLHLKIVTVY